MKPSYDTIVHISTRVIWGSETAFPRARTRTMWRLKKTAKTKRERDNAGKAVEQEPERAYRWTCPRNRGAAGVLQHDLDHRVRRQRTVQIVELFPAGSAHRCR